MQITFEKSVDEIALLVKQFRTNRASYLAAAYKEAHARQEFIDPFFMALGWDVHNDRHYAPDYREVIFEDTLEIAGQKKAPDYAFRVGKERKFFAEAKKPGVDLKVDPGPAYQLRRYAWTAKLPLSILTDFEELAIYDCRQRPTDKDKVTVGRINYLTYEQYADQWRSIWDVFSREAVLQGSFDQYAQTTKGKRGTSAVDDAFLEEIEGWRDSLARNLATRNPKLTLDELNDAVQRIIDRIIFLRVAEDKGVEDYGRLRRLTEGENIYAGLLRLSKQADAKYNSGLFDFSKQGDSVTPRLTVDDKVLKPILADLYFPHSPYEFSVMPVEILGNVYEQFLGKVIKLTAGHQAKVEEKPEVKKAGGVYYTPAYIVKYIVQNTVGKLTEGKSPKDLKGFRVLDPACGSGSFLLGAYQFLMDYYLNWYTTNDPEKWAKGKSATLRQVKVAGNDQPAWRLTTGEKKRILTEHVYGVDIDRQAVEVTKLSLLLKVLENEDSNSLGGQLALIEEDAKERVLPNLDQNIKCGNSLIGLDYFTGQLIADPEELKRVNPFDWSREFDVVFAEAKGFDCIIGNPPYLFITELENRDKAYFFRQYATSEYRFDVYGLFTELSLTRLIRPGGYVSFIIPHTLLSNDSFEKLRRLLIARSFVELVVDIGPGVFSSAKNETMIFAVRKPDKGLEASLSTVISTTARIFPRPVNEILVDQKDWVTNPRAAWLVNITSPGMAIIEKLETQKYKLGDLCTINQGLRTGDNDKYISESPKNSKWKPAVGGKHIGRYEPLSKEIFVYYEPTLLDAPRREEIFKSAEKLIVQEIRNITLPRRIIATYDAEQFYCLQSTNVINLRSNDWSLKFLLGLMNSTLINFFFRQRFSGNNHIASNQLAKIPVTAAQPDQMRFVGNLVETLLELHKRMAFAKDERERGLYQRQIEATDKQIDALVYELYGLTAEEIAVVEGK